MMSQYYHGIGATSSNSHATNQIFPPQPLEAFKDIFLAWLRKEHIVNERLPRLCYIIVRLPSRLRLICEPVRRRFRRTPFIIDVLGFELLCGRSRSINTAPP